MKLKIRLIRKRECYRLTWSGRLLLAIGILSFLYVCFLRLPFFLSRSNPVEGNILVVDGYLPDSAIKEAMQLYYSGEYKYIVVSGGDLASGYYLSDIKSMAELSYHTFIALGMDSTKIIVLSTGAVQRNRTYSSAQTLKNWLDSNSVKGAKINIVAVGCHARRSEYLFRKALGNTYEVGVYTVADRTYEMDNWWKSSKGMRTVLSESIGYFYSILFFTS